jgi:hypothetical protein
MKKYCFLLIVLVVFSFFGCEDEEKRPAGGTWNTSPIQEYTVTPINGGATISYTIADDPGILYIMAEYERNGQVFTEKSSVHKNTLSIEGFHRTGKVKAKLYKVNRQEERSEPIEVEFEPLESLIDIASGTWTVMPSFGGFIASWNNPQTTELGVRLMMEDKDIPNEWKTREMYFSVSENEKHSFRGFDAVETNFAITIEDKWGNISDTIKFTTTPFFETLVPKPYADFRTSIPYDNITNLSGRTTNTLWDNIVNTSAHGWLTNPGGSGLSITFDMKQVVKLSRIIMHPYHVNSAYGQANITEFEAWGINKIDYVLLADKSYWLDSLSVVQERISGVQAGTPLPERTFKDDWEYLGYHSIPIYTLAAEIQALSQNGGEYEIPIEAAPVRYVRIFVRAITLLNPPPTTNYFSMSEISFYGDNTVPQE